MDNIAKTKAAILSLNDSGKSGKSRNAFPGALKPVAVFAKGGAVRKYANGGNVKKYSELQAERQRRALVSFLDRATTIPKSVRRFLGKGFKRAMPVSLNRYDDGVDNVTAEMYRAAERAPESTTTSSNVGSTAAKAPESTTTSSNVGSTAAKAPEVTASATKKSGPSPFGAAFKAARKEHLSNDGPNVFEFGGNKYTTEIAEEKSAREAKGVAWKEKKRTVNPPVEDEPVTAGTGFFGVENHKHGGKVKKYAEGGMIRGSMDEAQDIIAGLRAVRRPTTPPPMRKGGKVKKLANGGNVRLAGNRRQQSLTVGNKDVSLTGFRSPNNKGVRASLKLKFSKGGKSKKRCK